MQEGARDVLTEVEQIDPHDAVEKAHHADAIAWIRSGSPIFRTAKPDVPPKHLVSYFVLYDRAAQSVLLVDHIKAQLWLPTGGHVDPCEHPRQTVTREAAEELRITATFARHVATNPLFISQAETVGLTSGHTDVSLWYVLEHSQTEELVPDPVEFHGVKWWSIDEIRAEDPRRFDPHLLRFLDKL